VLNIQNLNKTGIVFMTPLSYQTLNKSKTSRNWEKGGGDYSVYSIWKWLKGKVHKDARSHEITHNIVMRRNRGHHANGW
jgi:hypothetical protein